MTLPVIETKQLYLGQEKSSYMTALKGKTICIYIF